MNCGGQMKGSAGSPAPRVLIGSGAEWPRERVGESRLAPAQIISWTTRDGVDP